MDFDILLLHLSACVFKLVNIIAHIQHSAVSEKVSAGINSFHHKTKFPLLKLPVEASQK